MKNLIAITGGAGFIGSALVWGLNQHGVENILVVDLELDEAREKNLRHLRFADFMEKDEFVTRLEQGDFDQAVEGILHMGACSSTTEMDEAFLMRNNYEYSKRLASWALEKERRFVYASSAATYGDGSNGFSDDHTLLPELTPLNLYAKSKQVFDRWALQQGALEKIAGLKYFNVFGPNEYHKGEMRSVVHKAFGQIAASGKIRLFKSYHPDYKDGWQLRDFLYVKDAVEMTLFVYEHSEANGIFNIGTGKARSFYELVMAVFRAVGRQPQIEYIEMPEAIKDKYQYFTQAEMSKLRQYGYEQEITELEQGVEDFVRNYLLSEDAYLGKGEGL